MNLIGVFDRSRVSDLQPRPNSVLIMITSPEAEFPHIDGKWKDILRIKFDDIEWREDLNHNKGLDSNSHLYEQMSENQAKQILDFAVKNIDKDIFISCDAGLSRSPGVLVALEQIFNAKDVSDAYPHHNRFVKNMIRDTWFKTIWVK
jgi:predicted protein tyrosine phosphatase